jgi:hypothetical protein
MYTPFDVQECQNGVIVTSTSSHTLAKFRWDAVKLWVYGNEGNGKVNCPTALAALPDDGLVVQEYGRAAFQVFHDVVFRMSWIASCFGVY